MLKPTFCLTSIVAVIAQWGGAMAASPQRDITLLERESIFSRIETIYDETLEVPQIESREDTMKITGKMVDIGDVTLYVEQVGAMEGVPIVVVAGGPGTSHHYFHGYLEEMEKTSPVIYFDQRGVGRSDFKRPADGYTIRQDVEDLEALRRKLGVERWVLLAYSFGGLSSLVYSATYPESTAGVILMSSVAPFAVDVGLGERQYEFMTERERSKVLEYYSVDGRPTVPSYSDQITREMQMVKVYNGYKNGDWKRRWMYKPPEEKFVLFARHEWIHDKNYYFEMVADGSQYDLRGVFNKSPIPMMILEGKWDISFGDRKAALMAAQLPRAELVYSEHAGHRIFEDDSELFFSSVRRFMDQDFDVDITDIASWKKTLPYFNGLYLEQ